jgi:hypothetical protein
MLRFFYIKGSIQGREANILINLDYNDNYININLTNQLLISEPNIIEKKIFFKLRSYK